MRHAGLSLADLVDLEAQLARDRDAPPDALDARDRALVRSGDAVAPRATLLRRWLDGLRRDSPGQLWPGPRVEGSLRAVRAALAVAGLLLGWGAAAAVLQFTGDHPVNVWDFLLVFVGLQLVLLALLLASFVVPVAGVGVPIVGVLRSLAAWAYPRLVARGLRGLGDARAAEWQVLWHRLRSRRSLYRHVEPWLLLALTQTFGVAFNAAALLACLRLVTFSDLAFSWSTTLVQLDASRLHAIVSALAAPFGWAWPDAVPSPELVAATRYSRLEGAYVLSGAPRAAAPDLAGGWWPFLVASLVCYGLLPRLVTLAVAQLRAARLVRALPLDDVEVSRVVDRLAAPRVETRAVGEQAPAPTWPRAAAPAARPAPGSRCAVVLWRDAPASAALQAAVARQAGCEVVSVAAAGGREHEEGAAGWARLGGGVGDVDGVVVVAEAFEAPDRGALRLLRELRAALGADRLLRVVVVGAAPADGVAAPPRADDVRLWREGLARLEDPYLAVEPLGDAP